MDCGEGTQRQLKIAGIKPCKITKLLISHWHGDHVLGIPGLIQTMGANEYSKKLHIYGPKGTKKYMDNMMKAFFSKGSIEFEVHEITKKKFLDTKDFYMEAMELEHGLPTVGFSFIEKDTRRINVSYIKKLGIPDGPLLGKLQNGHSVKWKNKKVDVEKATRVVQGKKITYIPDTLPCKNAYELSQDSDLLISEASFSTTHQDKAEQYKHMTAKEAALIASRSNVKRLILTHFSQRYKTTQEIEEDARTYFDNITCAYDFMKINL